MDVDTTTMCCWTASGDEPWQTGTYPTCGSRKAKLQLMLGRVTRVISIVGHSARAGRDGQQDHFKHHSGFNLLAQCFPEAGFRDPVTARRPLASFHSALVHQSESERQTGSHWLSLRRSAQHATAWFSKRVRYGEQRSIAVLVKT